jgi:hypothetical protein
MQRVTVRKIELKDCCNEMVDCVAVKMENNTNERSERKYLYQSSSQS